MAGVRDVRPLPGGVRRPGRPPLPRPAQRLPRLRAARCGCSTADGAPTRPAATPLAAAAAALAGRARSSRSRASAGTTWPASRATRDAVAAAARAQAPRGQAVRADGRRTSRRRARWSSSAPRERRCSRGPSGRSCSRRGAPARGGRRRGRAGPAELGVMLPYSPLHHLLLADAGVPLVMTSGNVSDEPIAYRDEDALRAARGHRRPVPGARPADPHAQRRLGGAHRRAGRGRPLLLRRSRGYVPARRPAARRRAAADPRLRRRAQEHLLPRQGRARLGRPSRRRPRELRDAAVVPRGDRALRAPVRRRARGRGPRPAPGVPVHQVRARARGRGARRRAAPPRPPRRVPGRARRDRPGGRRDLRRHGVRGRRHDLGRRAAGRRLRGFQRAGHLLAGAHAGRRARPCASRGGWRAHGFDATARSPPLPTALPARRRSAWAGVARMPRRPLRRRRRPAWAACSTRSPRCAACGPR